jgi:SAM-dependent methyltransferase
MNQAALDFLFTPEGQQWLTDTAVALQSQTHLTVATRLRQALSPPQSHAVLETAQLRSRASRKFSRAAAMYFTRDGLEQASGELIAAFRAERFAQAGIQRILDLGCGLGGDALAFTAVCAVVGVDMDAVRLRLAQKNVAAYEGEGRFTAVQADVTQWPFHRAFGPSDALFFDPARRDEQGRRLSSVAAYHPPLKFWEAWRGHIPHTAVKISPGVAYEELPTAAEAEFISVRGEVKECVLWTGALHSGVARRATLLPSRETLTTAVSPAEIPLRQPQVFLYEPDGAIIRAHLVETLAEQLNAYKLSPDIAYLTANEYRETPFARCFLLWDWFPFQLKRLRHYLRGQDVGQVVVKKRGSPLDPDWLRQKLRLKGNSSRTAVVFLTQVNKAPFVLVGEPYEATKTAV